MRFTQPNNLSRVMSQILDQLNSGQVLTLEFANEAEAERGLEVLNQLSLQRQVGVVVTPLRRHIIELRSTREAA